MHRSCRTAHEISRCGLGEKTPMGDSIRIPAVDFLHHILPPLHPRIDTAKIVSVLKQGGKGSRNAITSKGRWRGFAQEPATNNRHRSRTFERLQDVVQAISKATGLKEVRTNVAFQNNHNGGLGLCHRERNFETLPDAYLLLRSTFGHGVKWMDIAVSGEYEKGLSTSDDRENTYKISLSMANILNKDPRRRFTYGFTIENTDMRLWYCDRSRIIVSESFNFIFEHEVVVHFFASFLYATHEQLGWDPTMSVSTDGLEDSQYDITVRSETGEKTVYRTLNLLSYLGSEKVCDGGTRVWKVVRLKHGEMAGDPVILKDCWVDGDAPREGCIFHEIRGMDLPEQIQNPLVDALLTVECYGDVVIGGDDSDAPLDHTIRLRTGSAQENPPGCDLTAVQILSHCRFKVHHRIVFKEVCQPIHNLTSFQDRFKVLGEACIALKALHHSGWVHRDISSGNILVDSTGCAKLGDLEYAKRVDDESAPEFRVGTRKFMAVEVDSQKYGHRPLPDPPSKPTESDSSVDMDAFDHISSSKSDFTVPPPPKRPPREPEVPFRYNPLHDFESLWWLVTYFVFKMEGIYDSQITSLPNRPLDLLQKQRRCAHMLSYSRMERDQTINHYWYPTFEDGIRSLDSSVKPFGMVLLKWRHKIVGAYSQAEEDPKAIPIVSLVLRDLYDEFARDLLAMSNRLAGKTILTQQPNIPIPAVAQASDSKKRKRDARVDEKGEGTPAFTAKLGKKAKTRHTRLVPSHDGPAARTRSRTKGTTR